MKKILTIAAVVFCALLLSGCEKHAFTISTNIFRVYNGKTTKDVGTSISMKTGGTLYIFAASEARERFTGGEYKVNGDQNADAVHHVSVETGEYKGDGCIVVKGISPGDENVSLNYYINGFHLSKTVTIKVK